MNATAAALRGAAVGRVSTGTLTQVGFLARRSITRTIRQPMMIVPSLIFPLFLLAVNSSGLAAATHIPGFPTDSYLSFAIGLTFMQGALFATMGAGQSIAQDIQHGFFNRLQLTPLRGPALIAGQLAGVTLQGLLQGVCYLIIALAFGAHLEAGPAGSSFCSRSPPRSGSRSARSASRSGCGPVTAKPSRASSRCCSCSCS